MGAQDHFHPDVPLSTIKSPKIGFAEAALCQTAGIEGGRSDSTIVKSEWKKTVVRWRIRLGSYYAFTSDFLGQAGGYLPFLCFLDRFGKDP